VLKEGCDDAPENPVDRLENDSSHNFLLLKTKYLTQPPPSFLASIQPSVVPYSIVMIEYIVPAG
jgi:hypothetical protein